MSIEHPEEGQIWEAIPTWGDPFPPKFSPPVTITELKHGWSGKWVRFAIGAISFDERMPLSLFISKYRRRIDPLASVGGVRTDPVSLPGKGASGRVDPLEENGRE